MHETARPTLHTKNWVTLETESSLSILTMLDSVSKVTQFFVWATLDRGAHWSSFRLAKWISQRTCGRFRRELVHWLRVTHGYLLLTLNAEKDKVFPEIESRFLEASSGARPLLRNVPKNGV